MSILLCLLLALLGLGCAKQLIAADLRKITFPSVGSEFSPNCTFSNGAAGVCKTECNEELKAANYQICYFLEGDVYTCCPLKQDEQQKETPQVVSMAMRLAEESCSKLKHQTQEAATPHLPFMFQIGWPHANLAHEYHFECLGVLIWPDYILTAAHCTYFNGGQPSVVLAANTTDVSQLIKISEVFTHPDYDGEEVYNDIALLRLERAVDADFACLWPTALELPKSLRSIGFRRINVHENVSDALMEANFTIVPGALCASSYKVDEYLPNGIVEQQMCAQHVQQQHEAHATQCQGDAGGPLLTYATVEGQQRAQIVGIASFGMGGCYESPPTVYTRVSAYLGWLEEFIWPKGSSNSTIASTMQYSKTN